MRKESILAVLLLVLSTSFLHFSINSTVSESIPRAIVRIEVGIEGKEAPQSHVDAQIGDTFEINVTVKNVTNLSGFHFKLYYQTNILRYEGADTSRSMLKADPNQYNFADRPIGGGAGEVTLELEHDDGRAQSGDGTLVTIKFYCHNIGTNESLLFQQGEEGTWRQWGLVNPKNEKIHWDRGPEFTYTVTHIISTVVLNCPKTYVLLEDVMNYTPYTLFSIKSDDVVLDLNHHTVNNTHGVNGWGYAINIEENHSNITIKNGNITNFQYAISMKGCEQVRIFNLMILNMTAEAIKVENSTDIHIFNNTVSGSPLECIDLINCDFSKVSDNILSNNNGYGIHIQKGSTNNTIACNQIRDNKPAGIYIAESNNNNNTIFNNNFINNIDATDRSKHVEVQKGELTVNIWNSEYPLGGNYWDDWNDTTRQPPIVDCKCGKNQTDPSCIPVSDGIGDTPYLIKGDTQDTYPLLHPFNTSGLCIFATPLTLSYATIPTETKPLIVAIFGNFSQIRNYTFNATTMGIIFDVDGGNFCNVIVPREIFEGPFKVSVDSVTTAFTLYWDGTNTVAQLNHRTQSHVEIIVRLRGDIDGDGKITITDIAWLAGRFGRKPNP